MISPCFDTYICVDWSARNRLSPRRPSADAIWLGMLDRQSGQSQEIYYRGRQTCMEEVRSHLLHLVASQQRVLLGCDFSYAYATGLAAALGFTGNAPPWWQLWTELAAQIQDDPDNRNNRFAIAADWNARCGTAPGPFWGVPPQQITPTLRPRSPGFPYNANGYTLERLRLAERRLSGVQESWKLLGTGSVGGQVLMGIPYLYGLRQDSELATCSAVWPFETGFTSHPTPESGPLIVHAELWPGIVKAAVVEAMGEEPGEVRDRIQVRELCRWAWKLDQSGQLGQLFDRPANLNDAEVTTCLQEEGWILGAV